MSEIHEDMEAWGRSKSGAIQAGGRQMMSISSQAGRRLARARAEMDAADLAAEAGDHDHLYAMAAFEFSLAAKSVADELIAHGFHEMEGD